MQAQNVQKGTDLGAVGSVPIAHFLNQWYYKGQKQRRFIRLDGAPILFGYKTIERITLKGK